MKHETTPSLEEIYKLAEENKGCNAIPLYRDLFADLLSPTSAYLKLTEAFKKRPNKNNYSFLFESVCGNETISRYSFLGCDPYHIIKSGPEHEVKGDPLIAIENYLNDIKFVKVPNLPDFTGGAVGYISFDCVKYFEPRVARELEDSIKIPESIHMFCDTLVIFDHLYQLFKVVSHVKGDLSTKENIDKAYQETTNKIDEIISVLTKSGEIPLPQQPKVIDIDEDFVSNVGKEGYENFVNELKANIRKGEIIQAVPSQRLTHKTNLHPFNVYRYLRTVNPAPYLFYLDLEDFQVVGASPEMLVRVDKNRKVYTHPIAGTRRRGRDKTEDEALEKELLSDIKETSEHVMLVDLGRNDINRVCQPETVKVDSLMHIERYSHVMHIVSNVSGTLRSDQTRFDAFRSVFPAGTVSGAPKVRALELIMDLEKEKRGVYAGSVGHFDYSGSLDTCISIRTMLFKDGYAYLQAGGGIVNDSDPTDEYNETVAKLGSNVATLKAAAQFYARNNN